MLGEELVLVEQPAEQPLHAVPPHQREQAPLAEPRRLPAGDEAGEVRPVAQVPLEAGAEAGEPCEQVGLHRLDGEERDEADERAHLEAEVLAAREVQHVVEELVVLVPEGDALAAEVVHRVGDREEVLEELAGDVLVDRVLPRELHRDGHHVQREHRHPARPVALVEVAARGEGGAPVEDADVVEPEEAALEDVVPLRVLPVHPPGEVEHQLVERPLEEGAVRVPVRALLDLVDAVRGPGVNRRVHVAERPLVGGDLPVRVLVPLAHQQIDLALGEGRVDERERDAVEGEVPRGVPGVLPLVGHRHHPLVVEVAPLVVPPALARRGGRGLARVAVEPVVDDVVVELLRPQHPGERLPLHPPLVLGHLLGLEGRVVRVRLVAAALHRRVEVGEGIEVAVAVHRRHGARPYESEPPRRRPARRHLPPRVRGGLGARLRGAHRRPVARDDVRVERVLHAGRGAGRAPDPRRVGLVLREEQIRVAVDVEHVVAERVVARLDGVARVRVDALLAGPRAQGGAARVAPPRPGVPEPERGQEVERGGEGAAVVYGDQDEHVVGRGLRVLDEDVEVAVLVEDARVDELELGLVAPAAPALLQQRGVGEGGLRVLVERPHVRVRRRGVEVVVELLDVLAVVALLAREAEEALLQDRVLLVPEREGEAERLLVVRDAEEAVLPPAVGAGPRVVVREVAPGVAVFAVVLAHGRPLPLAQVRPPLRPPRLAPPLGLEARRLLVVRHLAGFSHHAAQHTGSP